MDDAKSPSSLCNELFDLICDAIKKQMKPALFQLFSSYSEHDFTSVDLQALASSIISAKDESPADFVFQYEKDFVRKVNKNQQKLSELNNSIEELTKKLSVISRKQEKDRNSIKANHADVIAKTVDHDLQFNTANERIPSLSND